MKSSTSNTKVRMKWKLTIRDIIEIVFGGIFIYAALGKIINLGNFNIAVSNYKILPDILVPIIVYLLLLVEIVCGSMMILRIKKHSAMMILTVLTAIFILAMLSAIIRGLNIDCGCFNVDSNNNIKDSKKLWFGIIRDLPILLVGIFMTSKKESREKNSG